MKHKDQNKAKTADRTSSLKPQQRTTQTHQEKRKGTIKSNPFQIKTYKCENIYKANKPWMVCFHSWPTLSHVKMVLVSLA
jgi:hypothetical protein